MRKTPAFLLLAATVLTGGMALAARVYVKVEPPKVIVEERTAAPSPRHVWVTGYHRWDGKAYVWAPGGWQMPPKGRAVWVEGHWSHHKSNGWYWVGGHWK